MHAAWGAFCKHQHPHPQSNRTAPQYTGWERAQRTRLDGSTAFMGHRSSRCTLYLTLYRVLSADRAKREQWRSIVGTLVVLASACCTRVQLHQLHPFQVHPPNASARRFSSCLAACNLRHPTLATTQRRECRSRGSFQDRTVATCACS